MGTLHSNPITRDYTGAGPPGVFVRLVSIFIGWVLPFLVAYATTYLWVKELTYWEQADVAFVNKAVVTINGVNESDTAAGRAVTQLKWVSLPAAEQYLGDALHPMRLSHYAEDVDSDGKTDRIYLDLVTPLPSGFRAYSVDIVYFFQFNLKEMVVMEMESIGHISHSAFLPIESIQYDADLKLEQRGALVLNPFTKYNEIYNVSRFSVNTIRSPLDLEVSKVVGDYGQRNESTSLRIFRSTWEPDRTPATAPRMLTVSMLLRNVLQPITHTTDLPQVLKFGLVQYFVLWYIFTGVAAFLNRILVEGGVVNTVASCPELDVLHKKHSRVH
eukprot:TRINITY_DN8843_c0_g1_i1.p1 TRINITY_DN8843_c0_g1~~TRINITY_DN8843_c0_g1_i1.p1  ORF type:complete len:360 (+),score=118.45 TRINITY_DN8843_c0_g1_i1:95-1081(+)